MNYLSNIKRKFIFYPSFISLLVISIPFRYIEQVLIYIFVLFIHELLGVFIATCMGFKIENITFTPIGIFTNMKNIELLRKSKKIIIILSGSTLNILIWFLFSVFFKNEYLFFANCNLIVGVFNFLPMLHSDSGRLIQLIFSERFSVFYINTILLKISKIISFIFVFLGFIQLILYPFNIIAFCLGVYIYKSSIKGENVIKLLSQKLC